jgi:hypothetical protein
MNALYAKHGEIYEAMFLEWVENINGRIIKVIRLDDALDPVKGIAAVKKLVFDENVFMLCSGQSSNARRLIEPKKENVRLKRLVTDLYLYNAILKEVSR